MSEKQPKKKKTAGDVVLTVVLIAAICVFCYAGYNLFHIYTEYKKGTDEYNSITQMAVTERDPDGEAAGPEAGSELKAPMDIDFASLKSVNNDVVGWIYVEAVPDINYPIVHGKDNETYLLQIFFKFLTRSLKQCIGITVHTCSVRGDNLIPVVFLRCKDPEIFALLISLFILCKLLKLSKHGTIFHVMSI